jgi:hypothetical protein
MYLCAEGVGVVYVAVMLAHKDPRSRYQSTEGSEAPVRAANATWMGMG